MLVLFFLNNPAPPEISTLSLHDALPICPRRDDPKRARELLATQPVSVALRAECRVRTGADTGDCDADDKDRKSTRLNSSHANISYAVFCLKKKLHGQSDRDFRGCGRARE